MPKCSFKGCKNITSKTLKNHGISYFRYPRDPIRREEWIYIVSQQKQDIYFKPNDSSVVCSKHFFDEDIYVPAKGSKCRLRKTAIPRVGVMGRKSKLYYGDSRGTRMRKKRMLEKLQAARSKRQNIQKRRDNAGTLHENDNVESQLPSTSTVDKELEIPESTSEIAEETNKCDQTMTFRRKRWLQIINRPDLNKPELKPTSYGVCSKHFDKSSIIFTPKLQSDAIPTRFAQEVKLSDVFEGQSSSGTGESNTKGRASTCQSTKLIPLLKSSEDIIASVYNYLKAEYKQLKSSIGTSCDLSPLANILQRTAAATGVSEQTVSAILDERKRSADEELDAGAAKRAKLSHDYGDGSVSPITDEESSCEAPDTEQDDNNEETQASQESEEPEVETLKVEIKEEEDDKPVDPLLIQMNETDSAVQHLIFSSNSDRSNISIATDTNSAQVRNPPAVVFYPQSRSGVLRVMSQEPLSSLATVKTEPDDDYSSEVKTEPPPS